MCTGNRHAKHAFNLYLFFKSISHQIIKFEAFFVLFNQKKNPGGEFLDSFPDKFSWQLRQFEELPFFQKKT
jgi:hypothetical protein